MDVAHGSTVETVAAIISRRYTTFGGSCSGDSAQTCETFRLYEQRGSGRPLGNKPKSDKSIGQVPVNGAKSESSLMRLLMLIGFGLGR